MKYFEAYHVESFKDKNGKIPEILLVDGNRTGGKTTAFSRLLVDDFLKDGKKFFLVYRYKNELADVADAFFKDIRTLFFDGHEMTAKGHAKGAFFELFLDKQACGYASSLTMAGKLKRYSHIFSDVAQMFFDEYQDESGLYLPDETKKLLSLHTTIARGRGQAVRFVPLYMASNSISIFNPYYQALGITGKINSNTKVFRGDGFVLLRLTIKDVAEAQKQSAFNRAFAGSGYLDSAIDNSFLNDDSFHVEKRTTCGRPLFGFFASGIFFTVYLQSEEFYVRRGGDQNVPNKYGVAESDRGSGTGSFRHGSHFRIIRKAYEDGTIWFDSQETKKAFQTLIF